MRKWIVRLLVDVQLEVISRLRARRIEERLAREEADRAARAREAAEAAERERKRAEWMQRGGWLEAEARGKFNGRPPSPEDCGKYEAALRWAGGSAFGIEQLAEAKQIMRDHNERLRLVRHLWREGMSGPEQIAAAVGMPLHYVESEVARAKERAEKKNGHDSDAVIVE